MGRRPPLGYPGVHHAFYNDTSAERYDKAAAELAWSRTLDFFKRTSANRPTRRWRSKG